MRGWVSSFGVAAVAVAVVAGGVSAFLASGPTDDRLRTRRSGATVPEGSGQARWVIQDLGARFAPRALNDRGQIVGTTVVSVEGQEQSHAALWENGRKIDLTPRLPLLEVSFECKYPSLPGSEAVAVNERGQVIVNSHDPCGLGIGLGPWLWHDGKLTSLGSSATLAAINERGDIVGHGSAGVELVHAFLWRNGMVHDLGTLGGASSYAMDINERSQIAGSSETRFADAYGTPIEHAFLWEKGRMRDLGTLGGDYPVATDINGRGEIVGRTGGTRGFVWRDGNLTDLGALAGVPVDDYMMMVIAINDRGQVMLSRSRSGGEPHGFVWKDGRLTDLGTLQRSCCSTALAINDRGQVIGDSGGRAFVWEKGRMTELGTLGGNESHAVAINDLGQIVGSATTANGELHAVLWTPRSG